MLANRFVVSKAVFTAAALIAMLSASCVGSPAPAASGGTPLSSAYRPADEVAVLTLLEGDALDRWGRSWTVNPFLPQVKTLSGQQFELWALSVRPNGNVAVTFEPPKAYDAAGVEVGRSYEREEFLDFWLSRSDEEDEDAWQKKRRTIEEYVPWYGSPFPMYAGNQYIVVIVAPKGSAMPARFELAMDVDGVRHIITLP